MRFLKSKFTSPRSYDYVVVGIGNPGAEYAGSRHNVGAWTINRLAKKLGAELKNSRLAGTAEAGWEGRSILLVRPRTFVNESGRAVAEILRRTGTTPERLLVVCDELDLPAGQVRVRPRGGHGGHNGMRSIIGASGASDFPRVRIGIGRPMAGGAPSWDPEHVAGYVLSNPPPEDRRVLESAAERAADAVLAIISEGVDPVMNRFNHESAVN